MKKKYVKIVFGLTLVAVLGIALFYWNEAKKEIVFLCGNFSKGVSEQSVRRQLDTGNLLRYRSEPLPYGKRIIVDSAFNLSMYKCMIDIDVDGKVAESHLE